MSDELDFLLARIAEDETVANAASAGPWSDTGPVLAGVVTACIDTVAVCNSSDWVRGEYTFPASTEEAANSVHVARWDPARVLAECQAKRQIIKHVSDVKWSGSYAVRDVVLADLALPYADHPDYRDEWRP